MFKSVFTDGCMFSAKITFRPMKSNDFDLSRLAFVPKMWSKTEPAQSAPPPVSMRFCWGIMAFPENDHILLCLNPSSMLNACFVARIQFGQRKAMILAPHGLIFHRKCGRKMKSPKVAPPVTMRFIEGIIAFPEKDHIWLCLNLFSMMNACLCPQIAFV